MSEDRGDGQSKHASLQQAASIFVDVMLEGDGVGLVRFNQDAQVLQPIVQLGDGSLSDINRGNTKDIITGGGLDPNGQTSIGDGIFEGRGILNGATGFDVNSLVVLTDGVENSPRMISDVADQINEYTYAVGLGQPQNISVPALQTISGNNGGYLLVTGAISTDNRFLLEKYFLQILAGISNAEIVLDPDGQLIPGHVERVPFQLTSGDAGVDVFNAGLGFDIIDGGDGQDIVNYDNGVGSYEVRPLIGQANVAGPGGFAANTRDVGARASNAAIRRAVRIRRSCAACSRHARVRVPDRRAARRRGARALWPPSNSRERLRQGSTKAASTQQPFSARCPTAWSCMRTRISPCKRMSNRPVSSRARRSICMHRSRNQGSRCRTAHESGRR